MKLEIKNLSKAYGKNVAVKDFCAEFSPGIYALLGPNGSGKSTLMNILTDNLKADSGVILFEGEDIRDMGGQFRERIGYMPQYPGMYPNFSVDDFMWYMASLKDIYSNCRGAQKKEKISAEISEILESVELNDVRKKKIKMLSGGMKQRLALAQAVLGNPSVLILDEPTAGLDPKQRIVVRNYLSRIAFDKIVIIATHIVSDVEFISQKVIMIKKGETIAAMPAHKLTEQMAGKVWIIPTLERYVEENGGKYRIINISHDVNDGGVLLRIISDTQPTDDAQPAVPTLEDYYFSVFGEVTV